MEQSFSWEANRSQLVKKFPAFYGTRGFVTAFTRASHLCLAWSRSIQSSLIFSHVRLGLPSGLLPSGFPAKTLYASLLSPIRATCPAHLILLYLITRTKLSTGHEVPCYVFFSTPVTLFLVGLNIVLSTLFSNTLSLFSCLHVSEPSFTPT